MARLSKTASGAVAAAVVATAAAIVPFVAPGSADDAGGGTVTPVAAPATSTSSSMDSSRAAASSVAASTANESSGLPAGAAGSAAAGAPPGGSDRAVLFIGDGPTLQVRGGVARSFACQAAVLLHRRCQVWAGRSAVVPASVRAGVVVLVLGAADDARSVGADLDALPASLGSPRTVVLEPVTVQRTATGTVRSADVARTAVAHGAAVIDPVALHWVTPATRTRYLSADGSRLTPAGTTSLAALLARALRSVAP